MHLSNHQNVNGFFRADGVVGQLLSESPETQSEHLRRLSKLNRDQLDWAGFWRLLQEDNRTPAMLQASSEELIALHSMDCRELPYRAFAGFVLTYGLDTKLFTSSNRSCRTSLGPMAIAIAQKQGLGIEGAKLSEAQRLELLEFLQAELSAEPGAEWRTQIDGATLADLEALATPLIASHFPQVLDLSIALERITGALPNVAGLSEYVICHPQSLASLYRQLGRPVVVRVLGRMLSGQRHVQCVSGQEGGLKGLLAAVLSDSFSWTDGNWPRAWSHLADLIRLLRTTGAQMELADALHLQESLDIEFEQWMEKAPPSDSARFFGDLDRNVLTAREQLSALQFGIDFLDAAERSAWFSDLVSQTWHPVDEVIFIRAKLKVTTEQRARRELRESICRLYQANQLPEVTLSTAQLRERLVAGAPAGCLRVADENGPIEVPSDKDVRASRYSVIRTGGRDLKILAPTVSLGIVDLSSDFAHPSFEPQLNAPEMHAVVLPVVFGLELKQERGRAWRGTHFLLVHLEYRNAQDGFADPRNAELGVRGGNLLISSDAGSVDFISAGSAGQVAPPAIMGGLGDVSKLNSDLIYEWVEQIDLDPYHQKRIHPFTFEGSPAPTDIKNIYEGATRSPEGSLLAVMDQRYFSLLPKAQMKKLIQVCTDLKHDASTKVGQFNCLKQDLVPRALEQVKEFVSHLPDANATSLGTVPGMFNPQLEYAMPQGKTGPMNSPGQEGQGGELKWSER